MQFLTTVIAFIVALGTLIVFHELGHYWVARWCGVKVLRFSVGFGKPFWVRRLGADQTEWAVAALPLGGYVKMLDERVEPVPPAEAHRAFNRQTVGKRAAIVAAGPIANFLLAAVFYWVMFVHGVPGLRPVVEAPPAATPAAAAHFEAGDLITRVAGHPVATWQELHQRLLQTAMKSGVVAVDVENVRGESHVRRLDLTDFVASDVGSDFLDVIGFDRYQPPIDPVIGKVVPGSVAERAGLQPGDEIRRVDDIDVDRWEDLVAYVRTRADRPVRLEVLRGNNDLVIDVTPVGETDNGTVVGRIGVVPHVDPDALQRYVTEVRFGPVAAVGEAVQRTWEMSAFTVQMLWKMVAGQLSLKNLSGPLTIADYAGQSAKMGWIEYIRFLAIISISLGVLNLLPVPVLDGGHLMYYAVEVIKGSPVSERSLEIGQRVGVAVLFSLMAFALYNDIQRLAGGS